VNRLGLPQTQAARFEHACLSDDTRFGKCVKLATVMRNSRAEALNYATDDGRTGVQAHLLKGHDVREHLEQTDKPWRPHAAQRTRRRSKQAPAF